MDFDLVIQGGEVVDPGSGLLGRLDVGIKGGVIAAVDRGLPIAGAESARKVLDPSLPSNELMKRTITDEEL